MPYNTTSASLWSSVQFSEKFHATDQIQFPSFRPFQNTLQKVILSSFLTWPIVVHIERKSVCRCCRGPKGDKWESLPRTFQEWWSMWTQWITEHHMRPSYIYMKRIKKVTLTLRSALPLVKQLPCIVHIPEALKWGKQVNCSKEAWLVNYLSSAWIELINCLRSV